MRVLLTNDDGVHARGLRVLAAALRQETEVVIAAPSNEKSASSHSISLGQKLRVEEFIMDGIRTFSVHGTPADCVKFALSEIKGFVPDLVVSGINPGANTGVSVYYSGTISAAREASINRIPAMAVSLCSKTSDDFDPSVQVVLQLVRGYAFRNFSNEILLSVNIPALSAAEIKGIRLTKQAASRFVEEFVTEKDHEGKKVYSLAGAIELYDPDGTSDEEAVAEGFVSITPLKLDMTDYAALKLLQDWIQKTGK